MSNGLSEITNLMQECY